MKKLIIDCSEGMSVFVDNGREVLSHVDHDQKKHTDNLLVWVDKLLEEADVKISEIDVFCVCVGPGSFTGIRVAVSIVKGLAINSNAKICEASNFDILSFDCNKDAIFVLEGFSKFVYVRTVKNGMIVDRCIDIDEFSKSIFDENNISEIYAQNEKVQNLLKSYAIMSKIAENKTNLCFNKKIESNDFVDINNINPIYLRASQAEIERLKKLEKGNF